MKKLALIIVVAFTFGITTVFAYNNEENKKGKSTAEVKVHNELGSAKYNVLYKSETEGLVRVQIYDKSGKLYLNDPIKNEKTFTKTFNLKDLPAGEYTMEIISKAGSYKKIISHGQVEVKTLSAKVLPTATANKFNLVVNSGTDNPVNVKIYNGNNQLLYKETITEKSFNKIYDLSLTNTSGAYFEITNGSNRIVEKAL